MKKLLKALALALLSLAVVAGGGVAWLALRSPAQRPASTETIERTPERLARGAYLAQHVSGCFGCHSQHPPDRYGYPIVPGTEGQGQLVGDEKRGFPGTVTAANITSHPESGIGKWTDGEVLRALREGVDRNGKALFPMMPYSVFANLSDEDARSIVAYIRTVPPIASHPPKTTLKFPVGLLIKFAPKPLAAPVSSPDRADRLAYGKYLVNIGGCRFCHTPKDDREQLLPGKDFSGGWVMITPAGERVVTANITPHPDTYMGKATREEFIGRFKSFAPLSTVETAPVAPKGRNTLMPWLELSGATEEDLGMMYDYLKTVPPIQNQVNPFPDAEEKPAQTAAQAGAGPA